MFILLGLAVFVETSPQDEKEQDYVHQEGHIQINAELFDENANSLIATCDDQVIFHLHLPRLFRPIHHLPKLFSERTQTFILEFPIFPEYLPSEMACFVECLHYRTS
jgi:hypothetical protein